MANPHDDADALQELQDEIYREKILRARHLTPEQRLADAMELTNGVFARMHEGAMWQTQTSDPEKGWREVRKRLDRLSLIHDQGRFVDKRPHAS